MEETFGVVVIVVALAGAAAALIAYTGVGSIYRELGRSGLSLDEPDLRSGPRPGTPAWDAEAELELRQLLEAKSARATARGEPPLDVEAELQRLSGPAAAADPALRAEVRDMVVATNERRARRGQEPLDVEAEVERRLRDHGG